MKDFGTFDTLSEEEAVIYNRLAIIRRELDRLDYEQNDAQQDIKMWRNKMLDDKFKVKFWLVVALIISIGALPWYLIILYAVPPGMDFAYAYIFNIIASFMAMVEYFVFIPLFLICLIVFLVWFALYHLRNSTREGIINLAEKMGVDNRNVLIREQKEIVGRTEAEMESLREEEAKLKKRMDSILRERA
ncbi:MAG: ABC transporter permease [Lachnospiraceae bacterium]|nr:ABC transporter permease [Lachnospiraceae bacterium]